MNEIEKEVDNFIEVIKMSKPFIEYHKQLDRLKADEALKRQVDEYRREIYDIQNSEGDIVDDQRLESFTNKYAELVENPLVSDFLDAEVDICKMLQYITDRVVESVEFE